MLSRTTLVITFLVLSLFQKAQTDSVICDASFKINEGVYITYNDFRKNDPVMKDMIESNYDKTRLDFYGKAVSGEKLTYSKNGTGITSDTKNIWGYYQNNALHVNYNGDFFRVPLFGSISYLVATVEVLSPSYYAPGYGGIMNTSVKTKEVRDFLLNFYDGEVKHFSMNLAEELLSRDTLLYKEFKSLRPRKRKEQVSRYIRKYNELHPVYFLK